MFHDPHVDVTISHIDVAITVCCYIGRLVEVCPIGAGNFELTEGQQDTTLRA